MPRSVDSRSVKRSWQVGLAAGLGVVAGYLVAGLLVGGWNLTAFMTQLTARTALLTASFAGMVIASVAIPVSFAVRHNLRVPLGLFAAVALLWLVYAVGTTLGGSSGAFGIALYLFYLSPGLAFVLLVVGGFEYYLRRLEKW